MTARPGVDRPGRGVLAVVTAAVLLTSVAPVAGRLTAAGAQQAAGIAFSDGGAQDGRDLFVIRADGSDRRSLVSIPDSLDSQPSWSPDGQALAFTTELPNGMWAIARVEATTGVIRLLTNGPGDLEPDWSGDGRLIAFSAFLPAATQVERSTIAVMAPDGSGARALIELISTSHVITSPSWAPDSRQLAFVLRSNAQGGELYVTRADGRDTRRLFAHPGWDDIDPAWSPDGRRIAFAAGTHRAGQTTDEVSHGIWMVDVTSGAVGSVFVDPGLDLRRPSWSPDGSQLAMDGRASGGRLYHLYTAPSPGGLLVGPLTTGAEPDWGPAVGPIVTPGSGSPTPAASPTPGPPTSTLPPIPTVPTEPTLPPFPTFPPVEPTSTGPPPTFAWPSPTPTATATATASPTPGVTPTPLPSATATTNPTPAFRPWLYLPWAEQPIAE